MNGGRARLAPGEAHKLDGIWIDRSAPIAFTFEGVEISAFAGDSVLSALMANGIETAGTLAGHPLALGPAFAPPVALAGVAQDAASALPMARAPALAGAAYVGFGQSRPTMPGGIATRRLIRSKGALAHRFDGRMVLPGPWIDLEPSETVTVDLLVVGAGVAGLSAAIAAAEKGASVAIAERAEAPGGIATFFGRESDGTTPEETLGELEGRLGELANISVFHRTEVIDLTGDGALAHQVRVEAGRPVGRMLAIVAPRIVLATGISERLPVFGGNRLPGVIGTMAAHVLASRYGVWPGRSAAFSSAMNAPYRLATHAADVGIAVVRIADARFAPQSRHIDLAKATGITLTSGLVPEAVQATKSSEGRLIVDFESADRGARSASASIAADRLVVCGGWQRNLALWQRAGGALVFDAERGQLTADGGLPGRALAGSAAGYMGLKAVAESGRQAVAEVFGRKVKPFVDPLPDPAFETPDAAQLPLAGNAPEDVPAFLSGGASLARAAGPVPHRHGLRTANALANVDLEPHALTLADIAAKIARGEIAPEDADEIARERCALPRHIRSRAGSPATPEPPAGTDVPAYLAGRFGAKEAHVVIEIAEKRRLGPGALIYLNSDATDPLDAVGAVLGPGERETQYRAQVEVGGLPGNAALSVRSAGAAISARIVETVKT